MINIINFELDSIRFDKINQTSGFVHNKPEL